MDAVANIVIVVFVTLGGLLLVGNIAILWIRLKPRGAALKITITAIPFASHFSMQGVSVHLTEPEKGSSGDVGERDLRLSDEARMNDTAGRTPPEVVDESRLDELRAESPMGWHAGRR